MSRSSPARELTSPHRRGFISGTASVKTKVRAGVATLVEQAFSQEGAYGGLFGAPGNGWDFPWGSNRAQGLYGANLFMAARLGAIGARSAREVRTFGQKYAHFLMGLNPLNIPNRGFPAYAYRDFSVSWDNGQALSWEVTEPSLSYRGPALLLFSFLMSAH